MGEADWDNERFLWQTGKLGYLGGDRQKVLMTDVTSFILALPLCGVLDAASFKFAYNCVLP